MATRHLLPLILLIILSALNFNVNAQIPIQGPLSGTMEDNEYLVVGNIWVESDDSLFIGPRTEFLFNGFYKFEVQGLLRAEGTEEDSIIFMPNALGIFWEGISFMDSSSDSCLLRYCLIEGSEDNGIKINNRGATIDHSTIHLNSGSGTNHYGGIWIRGPGRSTISNCIVSENTAWWGGGITISGADVTISHCIIARNNATRGGGVLVDYGNSEVVIDHCLFTGNFGGMGGGIYIWGHEPSIIVQNSTIAGNSAMEIIGGSGGIETLGGPSTQVINVIIADNTGCAIRGVRQVKYSCLYGNSGGDFPAGGSDSLGVLTMTNVNGDSCDRYYNISFDPDFVNPETKDYHLLASSPCIDAGDPTSPHDPDSTIADIGAYYYDQSTGVEPSNQIEPPTTFRLMQNYPNPFNAVTRIAYQLPRSGLVSLKIYNILGQHLETLFDGFQPAGYHAVTWDAMDIPSGIYFARLQTGSETKTIQVILLK